MARSDRRVEIDELASEIANQLQSYTAEIRDEVKKAVDKVAKETVSTLKQTSPKDTGDYARNWTFSVNLNNTYGKKIVIHNKKPYYRLTHLLEFGHQKLSGGRVEGIPHIRPAEEKASKELEDLIKGIIK